MKTVNTVIKTPSGYVLKEINEMHNEVCNIHSNCNFVIKTVNTDPGVIFCANATRKYVSPMEDKS
jgi:hypothetical protein